MSLVSDALKQLQNKRGWGESQSDASTSPASFESGLPSRRQQAGSLNSAMGRVRLWQIVLAGLAVSALLALMIAGLVLLVLHLRFTDQSATASAPTEPGATTEPGAMVETVDERARLSASGPRHGADSRPQPGVSEAPRISVAVEQRYQLNMISRRGDAIRAVINHQSVEVGDYLAENVQVVDIQIRHVDLAIDGEIFRLRP